ncbi:hypothetical protein RhiirA5_428290 [Rhizophagus irregularis]|uniref:Uncharacterized protein n=1 Tax=Rhizophagus irregularis TaxID=588596 RepID=A0A2N0P0L4_9GLOM|nr:hypothetical protein RhiirA5_428290 [Rhizophagus irregularis]
MTSTLIVIGLITCLKVSDKTLFVFSERDLVLLGGKFTLDGQQVMVTVKMACILDSKIDSNGQHLEWDPATIPSTKPFMHICTTFVPLHVRKVFHTHSVHFEIGYSKSSKWFESIKDKWNKYTNFYIGEFLEAVYLSSEKNTETTYAQVDVKIIDFDVKSSQQNTSTFSPQSTSMKSILTSNINNNLVITIDDHKNDDPPKDSVNCSDNESTMQLPKCTRSKKQLSENQIKMMIIIKKKNQMINENSLIRS